MNPIDRLLREKIGLDAASVGSSSIERIVRRRMKSLGLKKIEEYQRLLESRSCAQGRDEWEELVESVVVTETWFFRDRDPFTALVQLVRCEWLPQHSTGPLRLLSLPCSSGEEPYSLAMALLDADIPPERFTIDAVDVSARALARAQRGVYGKNSFRGKGLDFRGRYFQAAPDGHALHPRVRDCVQFHRANIFEEQFLAGRAAYDFIFCRNLLIYFDGAAQTRALEKVHRLLAPQGVLFVGPAELPLAIRHGFVSANVPMAFACRRAGEATRPPPVRRERAPRAPKFVAPLMPAASTPISAGKQAQRPAAAGAAPPSQADLAAARQLADAGELAAAAAICQAHLDRQGPSAQAFYLLGLVHDSGGDPQAMDYYRKALYLEPDHFESLLQMSLLLEKNGDSVGARTFKRRAERVQQKP
ncbi:MAG: chemotaxis protein CheW [Verrucomicrobia bacterium]|jgi:chemotaxis protein methyltransferase WspC|nr:chemotaxis protein CheW [Verrucomicrobiota bacterium]